MVDASAAISSRLAVLSDKAGNITAGAGFRVDPLTIDYAYAGDVLDIDDVGLRVEVVLPRALDRFEEVSARFAEELTDEEMDKVIEEQGALQDKIDAVNGWDLETTLEIAMDALRCPPSITSDCASHREAVRRRGWSGFFSVSTARRSASATVICWPIYPAYSHPLSPRATPRFMPSTPFFLKIVMTCPNP